MSAFEGVEGTPSGAPSFTTAGETESKNDRLLAMQKQHTELFFTAVNAVKTDTQRAILTAIHHGVGAATYDEVSGYTSVSDRSVRKHASRLEDSGLIERMTDGTTACFNFASFEAQTLVSHVLTCYYTDSEDDEQ